MKKILLLIISIILLSCNARTVDKKHTEEEIKKKETVEKADSTKVNEITSVNSDILKKISDIGLEIQSDGNPYKLDLGGIKYEGSATIVYRDKSTEQTEKVIKTIVRDSVVVTYVNEIREEESKVKESEKHTDKKEAWSIPIIIIGLLACVVLVFIMVQKVRSKLKIW